MDMTDHDGIILSYFPLVMLKCLRCGSYGPSRWEGGNPKPHSANTGLIVRTCSGPGRTGKGYRCVSCPLGQSCGVELAYCYACGSRYDAGRYGGWQPVKMMGKQHFPLTVVPAFFSS